MKNLLLILIALTGTMVFAQTDFESECKKKGYSSFTTINNVEVCYERTGIGKDDYTMNYLYIDKNEDIVADSCSGFSTCMINQITEETSSSHNNPRSSQGGGKDHSLPAYH